ncbi:hypothetical protein BECAL_03050 [Bellilinea caldifistulae]|uniref:Uncharacterized protein n=1 Tax=Bellilinea caldifistulae TaxID=360411 RepID=A0A0P6WXC8_9CHLR|nr:hypothetical protein [Bellilinea caldifistulae]KPL70925.1 hypothetical protein AC812_16500 [Bellilinea caldifistulae]GAP11856.1 hypothetical protein BECAL_03050 [Bellilinea caldifistulae]
MRPEVGEIVRIGKSTFVVILVSDLGDDRWVVWLRLLGRGKRRYTTHAWRSASGQIVYGEPLQAVPSFR